jgi:hypothetical protein
MVLALFLSLAVGAANAAYEPKGFDVKHNSVVSNANRGDSGRNHFLNFVHSIQKVIIVVKNNVRDNFKTAGLGKGGGKSIIVVLKHNVRDNFKAIRIGQGSGGSGGSRGGGGGRGVCA